MRHGKQDCETYWLQDTRRGMRSIEYGVLLSFLLELRTTYLHRCIGQHELSTRKLTVGCNAENGAKKSKIGIRWYPVSNARRVMPRRVESITKLGALRFTLYNFPGLAFGLRLHRGHKVSIRSAKDAN